MNNPALVAPGRSLFTKPLLAGFHQLGIAVKFGIETAAGFQTLTHDLFEIRQDFIILGQFQGINAVLDFRKLPDKVPHILIEKSIDRSVHGRSSMKKGINLRGEKTGEGNLKDCPIFHSHGASPVSRIAEFRPDTENTNFFAKRE
jgi:hypothetical protein